MLHLGDIAKINGAEVPAVNVIIGGSPCQDLSVAGKRAGLSGERSGLFMEQLRIIKEMRRKDIENGAVIPRPRYMVWENVTGAFSSNKGRDFKTVLEETIGVVTEVKPDIPIPKEGWHYSGCIMGEGFSLAWRVFDAQFWGVPQRRRRIALVADFGGESAPEILFERESVSGNITQSGEKGQASTGHSETGVGDTGTAGLAYCIQGNCIDRADNAGCNGKGWREDKSYTLNTVDRPAVAVFENHGQDSRFNGPVDVSQTVSATFGMGGNNTPFVVNDKPAAGFKYKAGSKSGSVGYEKEKSPTLSAMTHDASVIAPTGYSQAAYDKFNADDKTPTLTAAAGMSGNNQPVYANAEYTVRRLTPLECERLQGFPDGWTDIGEWVDSNGKKHKDSDSPRYKALGNSIAIPPWPYVLSKLSLCCGEDHTMASLFDGIGGFPLIWEMLNGNGTCIWASEIEEFPIAVTKRHFS